MKYQPKFNGWANLTLMDMIVAYRKAKADCFFEKGFPTAEKFATYEDNLYLNLNALLNRLKDKGFSECNEYLGECRLVPKKLGVEPKPKENTEHKSEKQNDSDHVHFSCAKRSFEYLVKTKKIVPEFRVIGDFPVDTHIMSALWINFIGHKFDAVLDDSCYAGRLKRIRDDEVLHKDKIKSFHYRAIGSFQPYFQPYQNWRNDGLKAMRNELENDRNIIAVSLDLNSYYHLIDPEAIALPSLHQKIGVTLDQEEQRFTNELAVFLDEWSKKARLFISGISDEKKDHHGGLVIGLTVSRVISNVLLWEWDRLIKTCLTPIHYGRYVDDMFLVLRDSGEIKNSNDLMNFIGRRLGDNVLEEENKYWFINQGKDFQGSSKIKFQAGKQKLFILEDQSGIDLIDSIEKEIRELSSEHRLMPSPDHLEDSTAARVLTAAGVVTEQADTLRRADGLAIKRLSLALQLRHVETLVKDLPKDEWTKPRKEFYAFIYNHIIRADAIFTHFSYLPRVLGLAVSLNEWTEAKKIVNATLDSIDSLEKLLESKEIKINGSDSFSGNGWRDELQKNIFLMFNDAILRNINDIKNEKNEYFSQIFFNYFGELRTVSVEGISVCDEMSVDLVLNKANKLKDCDLSKDRYSKIGADLPLSNDENVIINTIDSFSNFIFISDLERFLEKIKGNEFIKNYSLIPYLFPTRPYTPEEIAEKIPECIGLTEAEDTKQEELPDKVWARYVSALRGGWVDPTLFIERDSPNENKKVIRVGKLKNNKVVIALTNIKTEESEWEVMACGKENTTLERYKKISALVNAAIKLHPKPDYLVFPELSLPKKWIDSIVNRLGSVGISLIAGTEYEHDKKNNIIYSEACLALSDNRLGYPARVRIWQPKLLPAVGEEKILQSQYGKKWETKAKLTPNYKPVYNHNGFHFGVMVCSELQNTKERADFQGDVDALMVLAWNKDLDTFSALVESAALDVHAYTILVNNRKYGDSRVRSPAKESFLRDLARLKGGDNDYLVAVTLDIEKLRKFQSKATRWVQDDDQFKPTPEGFEIHPNRKVCVATKTGNKD